MQSTFSPAETFNQPLVWDTGQVTWLFNTFNEAKAFNQPTSKVMSMSLTFCNAKAFNQQVDKWDVAV